GATPKYQQLALFIGVIVSSIAVGLTVKILDHPTVEMQLQGLRHAIGSNKFSAPQATLMATLIRGVQSHNLDWQFIYVGVLMAVVMELCGIKSLSFAIGVYLPLSTTLPIAIGGGIKALVDWGAKRKRKEESVAGDDLGKGNLFATGLVAGGALFGVVVAFLQAFPSSAKGLDNISLENRLRNNLNDAGYYILAVLFFALMAFLLYRAATKKDKIN
ncbi:MAG: OPT/YSL family transporter, partial [Flavisolibacter sp.]